MRRDHAVRIALALSASLGLIGCRAMERLRGFCHPCTTAVASPMVVDEGYVGDVYDAGTVSDGGCTTCQKSSGMPIEGMMAEEYDGGLVGEPMLGELVLEPVPHQAYSVRPEEEQPLKAEPAEDETPKKNVQTEPSKPAVPTPPAEPKANDTTSNRPAGLNLDLRSSASVVSVGDRVTFDLSLVNGGGSAIDEVDLVVQLSEGLRPIEIQPDGVARIDGQRVIFEQIRNFTPMTLSYRISAEAMPGMTESRISVEVSSPILTAGTLKRETVVRIAP